MLTTLVLRTFVPIARLDDRFRDTVLSFLERTGTSGRRFGSAAQRDPGFAATLKRGRRVGLATADAVLVHMGMAPIGPAFRREAEAFLALTRTKVYVLGEAALAAMRRAVAGVPLLEAPPEPPEGGPGPRGNGIDF